MTFRGLAIKNVTGNWHQYTAFFLSCTFSVMIFAMFASFIYHPDVVNGHIQGGKNVRIALQACESIIIIFSFFFVLYSESAFIKSRKKEFGLLSLFGMTRGQLWKLVFLENMLIAVLSILSGLVLGTLFSKLFLMVISQLLKVSSPIHFQLIPKAIMITSLVFLVLFCIVTLFQLVRVGKSEVIDLLRASRKPKSQPITSKWLVVLAVICLLVAYGMAYFSTLLTVPVVMFPVLILVLIGTYFAFTQGSVAVFNLIQKKLSIYYRGTNLVTFSQMIFKMKDNARVLFMVSILSAVVLTASGTFYIFFQGMLFNVKESYPETFSYVQMKTTLVDREKIDRILDQNGIKVKNTLTVEGVPANLQLDKYGKRLVTALLIPESNYNKASTNVEGAKPISLKKGQVFFSYASPNLAPANDKGLTKQVQINGKAVKMTLAGQSNQGIADLGELGSGVLVVNDGQFKNLTADIPKSKWWTFNGYNLVNWENVSPSIMKQVESALPSDVQSSFSSRIEPYQFAKQLGSLTMFIGIFVSFLFFIAAGSMIYFKLFTELQEDQAQFHALRRIGMSDQEIKRIVTRQIAAIFFVPFLISVIHALFAFKMLQNLKLFGNVWGYGGLIILLFFVMQLIYFYITKQSFVRRILR
ncbi:FtsX-like permease family protein [Pullulanibacillus sp. KACC 23026]|uniref:FtsX-like permease family protein n=1 Tax=Pullulanibacillus sp. KACC 23026 TaxID=3028315 RepID=UPI0023B10617|nr:FtsX-like permease family protein [Pullulanibacillus sp. KACC 23026]WEG11837.1 FtsX-like permease family protein [Pullulanibacillus sp. KACC 23026]